MNNVALFSVGSVIFVFLTWATIVFLAKRFSEIYRADQAASDEAPAIVMEGNTEVFAKPAEES